MPRKNWTDEAKAEILARKLTDDELADRYGVTKKTIKNVRYELTYNVNRTSWSKGGSGVDDAKAREEAREERNKLILNEGHVYYDHAIADKLGMTIEALRSARRNLKRRMKLKSEGKLVIHRKPAVQFDLYDTEEL